MVISFDFNSQRLLYLGYVLAPQIFHQRKEEHLCNQDFTITETKFITAVMTQIKFPAGY